MDGMNAVQIRDRSHLTNDELVAALATAGRRAVKGRWRTRRPCDSFPCHSVGRWGGSPSSTCSMSGSPVTSGLTASTSAWRPVDMFLAADHDARLVADLVAEWTSIHAEPSELVLEGPAGGKFSQGDGGERVEIDPSTSFARSAARLPGTGVLAIRSRSEPPAGPPRRRTPDA
ncbi:MAG TPA: hypothetical protein VHF24_11575 [Acidimicrobiales bacterium]|nr:hypothetical protein [Acidimicrobiales bacterium]